MPKMRIPEKKEPDDENDATTATARDKFKGELKKLYDSPNSSESEDDRPKVSTENSKKMKERNSRRPKMRTHVKDPLTPSFVMKLFDRSVDLTQFQPDTPLYPICRAWFRNNPKSLNIKSKDFSKKRDDRKISERDCFRLPSPLPMNEEYVPSPNPPPAVTDDFSVEYDPLAALPSKEKLLDDHLERWGAVRKRIRRAAEKRDKRYERSLAIIRDMCFRP